MGNADGSRSVVGPATPAAAPWAARPGDGPAQPTASAAVAHRPLGRAGARLTGGLLHDWQLRNRDKSLPLALRQLGEAGNLENLRLAAGRRDGERPAQAATAGKAGPDGPQAPGRYRGPAFMDSDLYKTLEAIGWELGRAAPGAGRQDITAFADTAVALIEQAQQADGYLNSWVQVTGGQRYSRLESSHELYCAGHLIQAAIAHSRATGTRRLLGVATRFADHLVKAFLGRQSGLDGHPIVETALVELYRETGQGSYLGLARQFVDQRGRGLVGDSGFGRRYLQDHQPVRQSTTLAGHAVRALYLECGVVDVAVETGDAELLASSVARWDDMIATKTALTGGVGSRHSGEAFGDGFELPPDRAYNETCAAIASFQWSWRLLLATGESRYADLMERVLFNGFAAATSSDGRRFFYINPLQRREDHYENDDPGRRREWFRCACCPPNIMRLLASLQHYIATIADDVLHVHQFAQARIGAGLAGEVFEVDVATGYPWSGDVDLRVRQAPSQVCGLAVRVPGWSAGLSARLNGRPLAAAPDRPGYLTVRRRWRPGDVLSCTMDLTPRLTYPGRRIDALRGTAAVERGPLVYCFEQADQPDGVSIEDLALGAGSLRERPGRRPGVGSTVLVEADAARLPPVAGTGLPYSPRPGGATPGGPFPAAGQPATATAVPYFQWDNRDGRAMRVWMPLRQGPPAGRDGERALEAD
ncbi:MAG: glycoside hydrolase family 127 protein [Streptosporangiaceae bacterium]